MHGDAKLHDRRLAWMASLAQQSLWRAPAFPGRWRVQRWAEQHADAFRARPPRRIQMAGFDFVVDASASLDVYLNGVTPSSATERILRSHVKRGETVLDIGANIGWTARLMSALVGERGQVHAFEPLPIPYRNLERNAAAAPLRNIRPYALAASDACGEIELFVASTDASALGTMRRPDVAGTSVAQQVPMLTLDSLIDGFDRVAFAKIDVEGAEHRVLLGMEEIIRRWRPTLAIEITDAWLRQLGSSGQQLLDHLLGRGYCVLADGGSGFVPLTSAPAGQVDVVCIAKP